MSGHDLTRWNRSGLARLRYVHGNAATYLELARAELARVFPHRWADRLEPPYDAEELEAERLEEEWLKHAQNEHLVTQYLAERGDLGWELLRAFARSCHVLTEQIDNHANGAFLRTAAEWDDVRRMVAMLDYHPAGATSATTLLALTASSTGLVGRGLQVRHRSADGGKPVVFETLEDLHVEPRFNELRIAGWDRSKRLLVDAEGADDFDGLPWEESAKARIEPDDSVLVLKDAQGSQTEAAWIVAKRGTKLRLEHEGDRWEQWELGKARLKGSPRLRRRPWINGHAVRRTGVPHGMSNGSVLAWRLRQDPPDDWRFAEVARADTFGLELASHSEAFEREYPDTHDDTWPPWGSGDIELRRAVRLTGSLTVPAASEAEKKVGELAKFTGRHLIRRTEPENSPTEPLEVLRFGGGPPLVPEMNAHQDAANLDPFIEWLFGAIGFATAFPLTPDMIVNVGAMIKTKDARIPSTGQLVYEAFQDLFGGGAGDEEWDYGADDPPALFRFWVDEGKAAEWEAGSAPGGLPYRKDPTFKAELWYLPKRETGGGDIDPGVADSEVFSAWNQPDVELGDPGEPLRAWFYFDGHPTGLEPGDWTAVHFAPAGRKLWRAVLIEDVQRPPAPDAPPIPGRPNPYLGRYQGASGFALLLRLPPDLAELFDNPSAENPIPEMVLLQGDYRALLEPRGSTVNDKPLDGTLRLEPPGGPPPGTCPGPESVGRPLLAVGDGEQRQVVRIVSAHDCEITVEPALHEGFTEGGLRLLGNVVLAGHGERRPPVRLGRGATPGRDGAVVLERVEVSTVPDSRLAHGSRPDLEVTVAGAMWHPVTNFDDSGPTDRHYTTSTTEEGFVELRFGDGERGQPLPPGTNDVEVAYRVGAGARGVLPSGALKELGSPHPLVEGVHQRFPTSGGADMEAPGRMRERAPASLLALDRAVSVRDFEQLAMQHRSVVQARAFLHIDAKSREDRVEVVVVPAESEEVGGRVREDLVAYLQHRAVPTVRVEVTDFDPVPFGVHVEARVDFTTYEADKVAAAVRHALADAFAVEGRTIGRAVHLSEVYAVVETVPGVEDSASRFAEPFGHHQSILVDSTKLAFVPDANAVTCLPHVFVP